MRKIVVDGKTYEWKVGRSFVRIRGNGHVSDIPLREDHPRITPKNIELYIRKNFLEKI